MTGAWTEERLAEAARLWAEGRSAAQIARALGGGITRSAVCGKLFRLGLTRTDEQRALLKIQSGRRMTRIKPLAPSEPRPPRRPRGPRRPPEIVPDHLVELTELTSRQCRWPFGDPQQPGFGFCGAATGPHRSYCADHDARARPLNRPSPGITETPAEGLARAWAGRLSSALEGQVLAWLAMRAGPEGWGRLRAGDLVQMARACGATRDGCQAAVRALSHRGAVHLSPSAADYVVRLPEPAQKTAAGSHA